MADPDSEVAKRKQSPLDYALLADQNTHPRITYEARIRNPQPRASGRRRMSDIPPRTHCVRRDADRRLAPAACDDPVVLPGRPSAR